MSSTETSGAWLLRHAEFIRAARHLRLDRRGSSGCGLGLYLELGRKALSDLLCGLGHGLLDRLVSTTRQVDIHLTELRCLGNVGIKRLLCVLRLDLQHLLERLRANQLLEGAGAVLEYLFGVVGDCGGNGLEALVHLT